MGAQHWQAGVGTPPEEPCKALGLVTCGEPEWYVSVYMRLQPNPWPRPHPPWCDVIPIQGPKRCAAITRKLPETQGVKRNACGTQKGAGTSRDTGAAGPGWAPPSCAAAWYCGGMARARANHGGGVGAQGPISKTRDASRRAGETRQAARRGPCGQLSSEPLGAPRARGAARCPASARTWAWRFGFSSRAGAWPQNAQS